VGTVHEWLPRQEPYLYQDAVFKLKPMSDKCIEVLGDCVENNCIVVG